MQVYCGYIASFLTVTFSLFLTNIHNTKINNSSYLTFGALLLSEQNSTKFMINVSWFQYHLCRAGGFHYRVSNLIC